MYPLYLLCYCVSTYFFFQIQITFYCRHLDVSALSLATECFQRHNRIEYCKIDWWLWDIWIYIYEPLGVRIHHCNRYVLRSNWHVLGHNLPLLAPSLRMFAETHRKRAGESHRMSAFLLLMSPFSLLSLSTSLWCWICLWYPWQLVV